MSFLSATKRTIIRAFCANTGVANLLIRGALRDGSRDVQTLSGNLTLTKSTHFTHGIIEFDPGGDDRTLTLPAEADMDGYQGIIANAADEAETLTVKEDAGSTTIATVDQNQSVFLACDGTRWMGVILAHSGIT